MQTKILTVNLNNWPENISLGSFLMPKMETIHWCASSNRPEDAKAIALNQQQKKWCPNQVTVRYHNFSFIFLVESGQDHNSDFFKIFDY